jgi:hypothetical protein
LIAGFFFVGTDLEIDGKQAVRKVFITLKTKKPALGLMLFT